ncbi:MAG: hypothetical protein KIT14_22390 [bacterium]|nr:hypothetical protein [bacterium]
MKYALLLAMAASVFIGGEALAKKAKAPAPTTPAGFIDVDNNGVWSNGDLPLEDFTGKGAYGFNAYQAQPGYKPSGRPVGLVVQRPFSFSNETNLFILSGNVRIDANITATKRDTYVSFATLGGDITIAPKVVVAGNGDVVFQTYERGDVLVGDNTKFSTKGEFSSVILNADGALVVGKAAAFSLAGGYNSISLRAAEAMSIAPGLTMKGPNHAYFDILCDCDLTLTDANVKSGYIHLESYATTRSPAAKKIYVARTTLNQTYPNGDFRIVTTPGIVRPAFAPDAIRLDKVKISTRATLPMILPDPLVR